MQLHSTCSSLWCQLSSTFPGLFLWYWPDLLRPLCFWPSKTTCILYLTLRIAFLFLTHVSVVLRVCSCSIPIPSQGPDSHPALAGTTAQPVWHLNLLFHVYLTRLAGWELLDCYLPTPPWSPKVTWVQSSTIIIWFSASWSYIIKSVKWDLVHLCHYWAFSRPMTPVASDRWTISGISKTTENKTCSGSYMHFMWLQLWINKGRWSRERVWVHYKSSPQQDKSCVHFNNKPFFFLSKRQVLMLVWS